jgi:hypothetical protein
MSSQKFNAAQREAIWLAHNKKCAYTSELIDVSSFHIDHIIPEHLEDNPVEFSRVKSELELPEDFDIRRYGNLLPCRPGANSQKNSLILDSQHTRFFLSIASSKITEIKANLKRIENRNNRGKALILLQQCLERGELTPAEVASILEKYSNQPEEIFKLIQTMTFSDSSEIRIVAKTDIEALRERPIKLGQNDHIDGVTLTNDKSKQIYVKTCREYDAAIKEGYFPQSTFDMKMATFFEHQCGLLRSLQKARYPEISFIADPKVGVVDLDLLPFSMFPDIGEDTSDVDISGTYQSKLDEGKIIIKKIRQNLLQVEEPEGMGHQLIEVARADFSGDGLEDILLFEYCYATHGTMGYGSIRMLTRKSADSLFENVGLNEF